MITRPTVRLSKAARTALDDVSFRTERAMSWILAESLTDLGRAVAIDGRGAAAQFAEAPSPDDVNRLTINIPDHLHGIAKAVTVATGLTPGEAVRAGWMRWLSTYSVDEIVAMYGEIRTARAAS